MATAAAAELHANESWTVTTFFSQTWQKGQKAAIFCAIQLLIK
jgi:hypothetical protein